MSDLPWELEEEVLYRVSLTSFKTVRSTCKKWNSLFKDKSFAHKHLVGQARVAAKEREFMVVVMMDFKVYLMRVNLNNINNNNVESCIKREGKLISLEALDDKADVSQVFHCNGLLLCVMHDDTGLMIWNPYWGQTRWIEFESTRNFHKQFKYSYALGYDKTSKSHKILRFINFWCHTYAKFKIYDFNTDSWRNLVVTPDWGVEYYHHGVSFKGNSYWFGKRKNSDDCFLVCFDFTREAFGPFLPVPIEYNEPLTKATMRLSSVKEEQLAVLFQRWDTLRIEIWVTTKTESNSVSWNSKMFLSVDINQLIDLDQFQFNHGSFFIDEEKEVAVVFDRDIQGVARNIVYIIGVDGSIRGSDLGESSNNTFHPHVCSYVSSLVQLN